MGNSDNFFIDLFWHCSADANLLCYVTVTFTWLTKCKLFLGLHHNMTKWKYATRDKWDKMGWNDIASHKHHLCIHAQWSVQKALQFQPMRIVSVVLSWDTWEISTASSKHTDKGHGMTGWHPVFINDFIKKNKISCLLVHHNDFTRHLNFTSKKSDRWKNWMQYKVSLERYRL